MNSESQVVCKPGLKIEILKEEEDSGMRKERESLEDSRKIREREELQRL